MTAERAHYFDAGLTQKIMEGWTVASMASIKARTLCSTKASSELRSSIQRPLTTSEVEIYGGEFTTNYDHGPFSAYGNVG